MVSVRILVEIRATEEPARVIKAVTNVFPKVKEASTQGGTHVFETTDLAKFAELLKTLRIRDPARSVMLRGREGDGRVTRFALNKQAAFMGRVNFVDAPGPLGDIVVEIEARSAEELELLIMDMAPDTAATSFVGDEEDERLRAEHKAFLEGIVAKDSEDHASTGEARRLPNRSGGTHEEKERKRMRRRGE
ncbi:MAG: hypothetical protein HY556_04385 [Euryarchaeota archaeon]|nr:hypothetical protein [Euryarchaeota archaeon]